MNKLKVNKTNLMYFVQKVILLSSESSGFEKSTLSTLAADYGFGKTSYVVKYLFKFLNTKSQELNAYTKDKRFFVNNKFDINVLTDQYIEFINKKLNPTIVEPNLIQPQVDNRLYPGDKVITISGNRLRNCTIIGIMIDSPKESLKTFKVMYVDGTTEDYFEDEVFRTPQSAVDYLLKHIL